MLIIRSKLKIVITVLASAGIRTDALSPLKLSHLGRKGDVNKFKIKIYENTKEESICFSSPKVQLVGS